jgi:hypothetical protein
VIVLPFEALWDVLPMMLLHSLNHLHSNAILTFEKERSCTELTLVIREGVQQWSLVFGENPH